MKEIDGFNDYFIEKNGDIYSLKRGKLKKLSPYLDTSKRYLMIRLIDNNGQRKSLLVHRLVAKSYIPNPNNLPEINHKDNNPQNPNYSNLEWITRKDNLLQSYKTMSPVRNYNQCDLYIDEKYVKHFKSISDAVRYCAENFLIKKCQLSKYLHYKNIKIIPQKTSRKNKAS